MKKLSGLPQFLAVSSTRNLTAAAQMLGVSQPALTQAVGKLERQLGVSLFDRSTRPMNLTAYGELLQEYAQRLEQATDDLVAKFEAMKTGSGGTLRIGCGPDWIHEILPLAISQLHEDRPQVRVNLTVALNDELRQRLDANEIDLFFSSITDVYFGAAYQTRILLRQRVNVVAGSCHPLADGRPHTLEELALAPWAMTGDDTFGRQLIRRLFSQWGVEVPPASVETNSVGALISVLHHGRMLGFLSRAHTDAFPGICIVETAIDMPMREGGVVWRSDRPLLPLSADIVDRVKTLVQERVQQG